MVPELTVAENILLGRDGAWQAGRMPEPLMAFQDALRDAEEKQAT